MLAEGVDRLTNAVRKNPQATLGVGLGLLAGIFLIVYFVARFYEVRGQAWAELAKAETQATSLDQSLALLQAIPTRFPGAPASDYAFILKGDILYFNGRYEEAAQTYRNALEKVRPTNRPFLKANLGLSLEAAGKYPEAAASLREFLDEFPEHFLAPQTYLALARCHEALHDTQQAKADYEKVSLLYPDTDWSASALQRLKELP